MKQDLQGQYAGAVTRGLAWMIDVTLLVVTLALTTWLVTTSFELFGINVETCAADITSLSALLCHGVRLGLAAFALLLLPVYKIFFGVRVVRADGKPMTIPRSIKRFLGFLLCFLTFGVGFALILIDNQRQGLHDTIARTYVIYAWRGEQNLTSVARMQAWLDRKKKPVAS
ncbi:MAG: hypothetical protein DCC52_19595 [Chloroflexi bacterium]|nr:MAG: hypothetical protein DCC52_19595 [Chloroflexota bacterium]